MREVVRTNRIRFGTMSKRSACSAHAGAEHNRVRPDGLIADLASGSCPAGRGARYTEVDGWSAAWRCERESIRILQVCLRSGAPAVLSTAGTHIPDLAEMRERFPEHTRLWDAIRRDFWADAIPEGRTG